MNRAGISTNSDPNPPCHGTLDSRRFSQLDLVHEIQTFYRHFPTDLLGLITQKEAQFHGLWVTGSFILDAGNELHSLSTIGYSSKADLELATPTEQSLNAFGHHIVSFIFLVKENQHGNQPRCILIQ